MVTQLMRWTSMMSKLTDEVDHHDVTAEEVDLRELCLVLFFNQCDWVIVSYPIIVLYCFEMS